MYFPLYQSKDISGETPVDLFYKLLREGKKLLSGLRMMEKKTFNNICCKVFFPKTLWRMKVIVEGRKYNL